jgi:hypothetical protein
MEAEKVGEYFMCSHYMLKKENKNRKSRGHQLTEKKERKKEKDVTGRNG